MIKSIFVGLNLPKKNYDKLGDAGANHLIVVLDSITKEFWQALHELGCDLTISFVAFKHGSCPLAPSAKIRLKKLIKNALVWKAKDKKILKKLEKRR